MNAVSLHDDVLLVSSQLLHANCTIVRDGEEAFVIDSPILPGELAVLPSLLTRAAFPAVRGVLATHGDWDHLLARIAFPHAPLGCAESTARRLAREPGEAQRQLRGFDEGLMIARERPLALGAIQALVVPGRCGIGERDIELHLAEGHTPDGMALRLSWAGVLVAGDYLSPLEIPTLHGAGALEAYMETLERLRPLVETASHVVPGHGPALDRADGVRVLEEDGAYLRALAERGERAPLPPGRRSPAQRELHSRNVAALA